MDDLIEFLRARLDGAEKAARALPCGPWQWAHHFDPEGNYQALEGPDGVPVLRTQVKTGAASWLELHPALDEFLPEPEAVLRRIAADRKQLDLHQPGIGWDGNSHNGSVCVVCAEDSQDGGRSGDPYPCATLRLLAEAYGITTA